MKVGSVGIAGEVRCVVTQEDGGIRLDTGYQRNLILDQGLEFFGGKHESFINRYCAIGSGNSTPVASQTKLDAFLAVVEGTNTVSDYSYEDKGDDLYRSWTQKKYQFSGLSDVNVSEVGLVSKGNSSASYFLTTRVLIKDSSGAPTSISIKRGEVLDVYYRIHRVIDITEKSHVVNVLDGDGGSVPYNVVVKPANAVAIEYIGVRAIGLNNAATYIYSGELGDFKGKPLSNRSSPANTVKLLSYVPNTYKLGIRSDLGLKDGNGKIRSIYIESLFYPFQARFGRVSDDEPLTKTASDKLYMPFELSWGRFEGEL